MFKRSNERTLIPVGVHNFISVGPSVSSSTPLYIVQTDPDVVQSSNALSRDESCVCTCYAKHNTEGYN